MLEQPPESFVFRINGIWGAIAATVAFLAVVVPLTIAIWKNFLKPGRERWHDRRTARRNLAFLEFQVQWMLDHSMRPIFIMDEDKRCSFVNETLCDLLEIDSSDIIGRGWHKIIRESELSRVVAKWDEAYRFQGPYLNISQIVVGRQIYRFKVTAEPFVYKSKVRAYIGTVELLNDAVDLSHPPNLLVE